MSPLCTRNDLQSLLGFVQSPLKEASGPANFHRKNCQPQGCSRQVPPACGFPSGVELVQTSLTERSIVTRPGGKLHLTERSIVSQARWATSHWCSSWFANSQGALCPDCMGQLVGYLANVSSFHLSLQVPTRAEQRPSSLAVHGEYLQLCIGAGRLSRRRQTSTGSIVGH